MGNTPVEDGGRRAVMSWSPMNVLNLRYEFVRLACDESIPVSELCRRYGISRKTRYKGLGKG